MRLMVCKGNVTQCVIIDQISQQYDVHYTC